MLMRRLRADRRPFAVSGPRDAEHPQLEHPDPADLDIDTRNGDAVDASSQGARPDAVNAPMLSARDDAGDPLPRDLEPHVVDTIRAVEHATMTSAERLAALVQSVEWLEHRGLAGAIVECGVWRGGSMMAAARTLLQLGDDTRNLYLYDTFAGMTEPQDIDRHYDGSTAEQAMNAHDPSAKSISEWCNSSLEEVRLNMRSTGYPEERIHYVCGPVEATIPERLPGPIAILRLDTDFYSSTRHELVHLYPLVAPGGVVIIDDYGAWQGARRAVDEFLADKPNIYLHRIDVTGRIFVKP
jgi:O-methyltransferase